MLEVVNLVGGEFVVVRGVGPGDDSHGGGCGGRLLHPGVALLLQELYGGLCRGGRRPQGDGVVSEVAAVGGAVVAVCGGGVVVCGTAAVRRHSVARAHARGGEHHVAVARHDIPVTRRPASGDQMAAML